MLSNDTLRNFTRKQVVKIQSNSNKDLLLMALEAAKPKRAKQKVFSLKNA
jgi:hypothetical protein